MSPDLKSLLRESAYHDYVYSYPHKSAYRTLTPAVRLAEAWDGDQAEHLHLYVHVPFCEMRCGFCNLFTEVSGRSGRLERYLDALHDEALEVRRSLPRANFEQMAVGGGTPTILPVRALERVLDIAAATGADSRVVPCSVEMSPATVDEEKLALLRGRGVSRVSIGVQSFDAAELRAVLRPQNGEVVRRALAAIAATAFPAFNVDLIYGLPGQTAESFARSIEATLDHGVTELYLYPLYVRPRTSLGKRGTEWPDVRRQLYTRGRDLLRSRGFVQCSMRRFRAPSALPDPVTPYRCQDDGMVGLGPGARSYTQRLHYSTRYAVEASGVRAIIDDYLGREDRTAVDHGFELDADERRRRFVILSLLDGPGLEVARYQQTFGSCLEEDFAQLDELVDLELARNTNGFMRLTETGTEVSDTIGHWLFSSRVRGLMAGLP